MGLFKRTNKKETHSRRRPLDSAQNGPASFSYYAAKRANFSSNKPATTRQSSQNAPKKHHKQGLVTRVGYAEIKRRFGSIVLALVLLVCAISLVQIDTKPRVVMLDSPKQYALHPVSDYERVVTDTLRSSLFNSNKVTVNTKSIVSALKEQFPEIYDASVVLPLVGHRPTVYIELARPALLLQTVNGSAVLDSAGRVLLISTSHMDFADLKLASVVDQSNVQAKVSDVALPSSNVSFISDVVHQFAAQGAIIDRLVLPAGKEELDVYPRGVKYFVKFNLHEANSREQAGTFFAVRQELQKKGTAPKQYIDVRLAGRAYYK